MAGSFGAQMFRHPDSSRRSWRAADAALAALLVLAALALTVGDAGAATRVCRQLEARLADVGSGGGGGGSPSQVRRYDRAIEAQQRQLSKARRQASRSNCGGFFNFDGGSSACPGNALVDRMERNLQSLIRKRNQLAGGGGGGNPRRERARILAALDANGCRDFEPDRDEEIRVARRDPGPSLFERLFGGGVRHSDRYEPDEDGGSERMRTTINPGEYQFLGGGSYRTLCVRTCDGYYWPISYSSSRSDFERDEQNCQTMCPGAEVRLFSHRVPEQESEAMVDGMGNAYADLPNAFKYREASFQRPETCTCGQTKKNFSVIAGNGARPIEETEAAAPIPLPSPRPEPLADPETLANRDGKFDVKVMRRLVSNATVADSDATDRKVRVVGPAYLPDPEAAEDPQAPGRTAVQ